jgi:hypothetical protein
VQRSETLGKSPPRFRVPEGRGDISNLHLSNAKLQKITKTYARQANNRIDPNQPRKRPLLFANTHEHL